MANTRARRCNFKSLSVKVLFRLSTKLHGLTLGLGFLSRLVALPPRSYAVTLVLLGSAITYRTIAGILLQIFDS